MNNPFGATEQDWQTIAALLREGCSLPPRLQLIHDAHQRELQKRTVLGLKSAALGDDHA